MLWLWFLDLPSPVDDAAKLPERGLSWQNKSFECRFSDEFYLSGSSWCQAMKWIEAETVSNTKQNKKIQPIVGVRA
jgi:hypothetical protein